jgi:KaiC/GvpD/RAD55 family RecA-like ATPase
VEKLDGHSAVLYGGDETRLVDYVVRFLYQNVVNGHPAIIVATPSHRNAFLAGLRAAGADPDGATASGNLVWLDAVATLENLINDGRIDWRAFDRTVEILRNLAMRGPLRVYGEMVGILWALGRHEMAIDLELHWNRLRARIACDVMCAYEVAVSSPEFSEREIAGVVRMHDRVLSGGPSAA